MRICSALLLAGAVLTALPVRPARAEPPGTFEISGHAGIRAGGRLRGREDPDTGQKLSDLHVAYTESYGAGLGLFVTEETQLEVIWSHQDTNVTNPNPLEGETRVDEDVTIDDYLLALNYHWGRTYDRIRPWAGLMAGGTTFRFEDDTEARFSFGLGAGLATPFGGRFRVRIHARSRWAYVGRDEFFCDANGDCWSFPESDWLHQWDFGGGLGVLF
jgi:hypothetical protein